MLTGIHSAVDMALSAKPESGDARDIESAAKAFESMFVNELMKSMRKANEAMMAGSELPMMGKDTRFFHSMFDAQLAEHLSDNGGLGIAQALIRQLGD